MNRLCASLIGAGLAIMLAGSAYADSFTIQRLSPTTSITHPGTGGDITLSFTNLGAESFPNNSDFPGTSLTLLNYTVTSSPTNTAPQDNVVFNDDFTLTVLLTDYSYPGAPTHPSVFNGHVSGFANAQQDNLIVDLIPANPDALVFDINYTRFTISDLRSTLPPLVNDTANPGAVSARIVSNVVPEPGSMALLGAGLLPVLGLLRRRR